MLLFPRQHSNIPQGPCEFAAEPWRTTVHGLGTTDTLPMIETPFKSLPCGWGNWAPVRSPRWFVAIQESECRSAHSAIPDLFPSWLIVFISNHHFLSPLCVFCNPSSPTQTHKHKNVYAHLSVQSLGSNDLNSPLSSKPFPETAPASILSPKFYLLNTCSYTNLSIFKTSVYLVSGMWMKSGLTLLSNCFI